MNSIIKSISEQYTQYISSRFIGLRKLVIASLIFLTPFYSLALSIFAHEAIIDLEWQKTIRPLLKLKYPAATDSELLVAHAYCYGGAIVPDMGYYSTGGMFFTNLVHYVYTGDFVNALFDEAENVNEYAFAVGFLSHYYADKYGHSLCTNKAVPIMFPKLKKKYGDIVTFEQAEIPHTRIEFGFDVVQTAMGNYKPKTYHDYIGFEVSQPVLERAFLKTYKLEMKDIFNSTPIAIAVFRFFVKNMISEFTKDAWRIRQSVITQLNPLADQDKFTYKIDKAAYEKEFGKIPVKSTILSFIIGTFPKIGPLAKFKFKEPSPEVEKLFRQSMDTILLRYSAHLNSLAYSRPPLENINYDDGKKTVLKEYKIADKTYEELLEKLKDKKPVPKIESKI